MSTGMQLSLIVRGQHPPGDIALHLQDDLELVPRAGLGKRFEECLDAVKRLWTEDFVSMKGSHFELDHANCTVKPLQQPTPPIWIGANADIAIRRAARMGDCWYVNPHSTLATIER